MMQKGTLIVYFALVVFVSSAYCGEGDVVAVDVYGEALCPDTTGFIINNLKPLFEQKIMDMALLNYVPYGNARYDPDKDTYTCQHGKRECDLNTVQSCVIHLHQGQQNWFPFLECMSESVFAERDNAALVKKCAATGNYTADDIMSCAAGDLGRKLQRDAMAKTTALKPRHTFVPWVVVNGVPIHPNYKAVGKYICVAYQGPKPDACFEPPQPSSWQLRG